VKETEARRSLFMTQHLRFVTLRRQNGGSDFPGRIPTALVYFLAEPAPAAFACCPSDDRTPMKFSCAYAPWALIRLTGRFVMSWKAKFMSFFILQPLHCSSGWFLPAGVAGRFVLLKILKYGVMLPLVVEKKPRAQKCRPR